MDDIERRLADLRNIEMDVGPPELGRIARRARVRRLVTGMASVTLLLVTMVSGYAAVRAFDTRGDAPVGPSLLAAAQQATKAEGTALVEFALTLQGDMGDFSLDEDIHATGEVDFINGMWHMIGDLGSGTDSLEVIADGKDSYQRTSSSEHPDKWVKSVIASSGGLTPTQQDPSGVLAPIMDAAQRVEDLGVARVDGATVDHYRVHLDSEALLRSLFETAGSPIPPAGDIDLEADPADVWIDREQRVRVLEMGMTMSVETNGEQFVSEMTWKLRFYDFGALVDIELPDPEDVVEGPPPSNPSPSPPPPSEDRAAYMVVGEQGRDAPHVLGTWKPAGGSMICALGLPRWAETATILEETADGPIAEFASRHLLPSDEDDELMACKSIKASSIEAIIRSPDDYALRIPGSFPPWNIQLTRVIHD